MKKLSELMHPQDVRDGMPIRGMNGYGGEQDGSSVVLSTVLEFASRQNADWEYPGGVPEHVRVHWCTYRPFAGWEIVLGWWDDEETPASIPRLYAVV